MYFQGKGTATIKSSAMPFLCFKIGIVEENTSLCAHSLL